MSYAKRFFGLCLPTLALVAAGAVFPETVQAAITFTGDYSPSDSSLWDYSTSGYVGNTAAGTVMVDSNSDLYSSKSYIGYSSGVTGAGTVTGAGSTWTNVGYLYVGYNGTGSLLIANGGDVSNSRGYIGYSASGVGAVAVDESGSTWTNSEMLLVGYRGLGILNITNGGYVSSVSGGIAYSSGTPGSTVTIDGDGSHWVNDGSSFRVGNSGSGTLNIINGGRFDNAGDVYLGYNDVGIGTTRVDGNNSTLTAAGELVIGHYGSGVLNITNGGAVVSATSCIGYLNDGNGTVTLAGTDSTWDNSGDLYVGSGGDGTLNIYNGNSVTVGGTTYIAKASGSAGTIDFGADGGTLTTQSLYTKPTSVTGTGTIKTYGLVSDMDLTFDSAAIKTFTINDNVTVNLDLSGTSDVGDLGAGYDDAGSLTIRGGITVNSVNGYLGFHTTGYGTAMVEGADSMWINSKDIHVGYVGLGILNVANGGAVSNTGGDLYVGNYGFGELHVTGGGTVSNVNGYITLSTEYFGCNATVDGAGSTWTNSGNLYIGCKALGLLNITNGGSVIVDGATYVGLAQAYLSTIAFNGGTLTTQSLYASPSKASSADSSALTGTGTINTHGLVSDVALVFDSSANLSQTIAINESVVVNLNVSDPNDRGDLGAGYWGTGSLTISNGMTAYSATGHLGYNEGSSGAATVTGDDSTWNNSGNLYVGNGGSGVLNVTGGGNVAVAGTTYVGCTQGSGSSIAFSGGTLTTQSLYASPSNASSALTGTGEIDTHGLVSDVALVFDSSASLSQTIAINESVVVNLNVSDPNDRGDLGAGYWGTGSLTISNGATVYSATGHLGYNANSTGAATVIGDDSTWDNSGTIYVGGYGGTGTGTLNITNGGTVIAGAVIVAETYQSIGIVNFDGGTLKANADNDAWLDDGSGTEKIYIEGSGATFDTAGYDVAIPIRLDAGTTPGGGLTKIGDGTLTLAYTNRYRGLTTVEAGTLAYRRASAIYTGGVTVTGGTLALGTYTDSVGAVTLTSGAITGTGTGKLTSTSGFEVQSGMASARLAGSVALTKTSSGTVILSGVNTYTGTTIVEAGTLTLVGANAWNPVLTVGGADIQAGKMVFDYTGDTSPASTIQTLLTASFTGGTSSWITGQFLCATKDGDHGLGWIDDGVNEEVTVMYTLYGDSNLDGSVNGSDLNAVLSNYNLSGEWEHGDFNYDGSVNGSDLNTVLSNYNQSLSASTAAVPEPSTLLLMVLGLVGLLAYAWRKRK